MSQLKKEHGVHNNVPTFKVNVNPYCYLLLFLQFACTQNFDQLSEKNITCSRKKLDKLQMTSFGLPCVICYGNEILVNKGSLRQQTH